MGSSKKKREKEKESDRKKHKKERKDRDGEKSKSQRRKREHDDDNEEVPHHTIQNPVKVDENVFDYGHGFVNKSEFQKCSYKYYIYQV